LIIRIFLVFNKKLQMKKVFLFFTVSFFLFALFGCQFNGNSFLFSKDQVKNEIENLKQEISPINNVKVSSRVPRLLDGLMVELGQENKLPVAVVFDNFPGAPRPTLASASIVYEMPVEGGLTRFLAIFDQANLPEAAGPIRSARPYSAEVAEEYKSLYTHAGGSPDALFKLKQKFYKVINLDEISWQGKYFWRDPSQSAPHNLYIKKEGLINFLDENKIFNQADFSGWYYGAGIRLSDQEAENIKINFSPIAESNWQYNEGQKKYQYLQNNKNYRDKNNQEILVDNIIIQYAPITILDEIGRRQIKLTGQGEALIFQQGKVVKGKWIKEAGRTKFYNQAGEEIIFISGKTWVSVVSLTNQVDY